MRNLVLVFLVLLTGAASAMTVEETTQTIRGNLDRVIAEIDQGEETWGERQALEDLRGLSSATAALESYLSAGDPSGPESTAGEIRRLATRAQTSRVMLHLSPSGEEALDRALELALELDARFREVRNTFDGRYRPTAEELSQAELTGPVGPRVYQSPEELIREARSVRMLAEELRARSPYWGPWWGVGFGTRGYTDSLDVQEVVQAAYRFEQTVQGPYQNVAQTYPGFERLRRAFYRAGLDFSMNDQAAARQLRRSMERLEAFYESL